MKNKTIINGLLAGALLVGASASAFAQQTNALDQPVTQEKPGDQFNSKDYVQIQPADVPFLLKKTLQATAYVGWENGKLYRHNKGSGYWITIGSGDDVKQYYFDAEGNAVRRDAIGSDKLKPSDSNQDAKIGTPRPGETYEDKTKH